MLQKDLPDMIASRSGAEPSRRGDRWRSAGAVECVLVAVLIAGVSPTVVGQGDPLAQARLHYNAAQYDEAIAAATAARTQPGQEDAAALVLGRSHIERFRRSADPDDLSAAREALRSLDPASLVPRDRTDFIVGLGETLFFESSFGPAAEIFESVLDTAIETVPGGRERLLDWWATAIDRVASRAGAGERAARYGTVVDRMKAELVVNPGSAAAAYWLAAGTRGLGDLEGAWQAAIAGWVRAVLTPDRGAALRADLDRLVVQAIIPERARQDGPREDEMLVALTQQWEEVKDRWTKR
jgi:hypothetical protein